MSIVEAARAAGVRDGQAESPAATPAGAADQLAATRARALAEHYQRTVDHVSRAWDRRNRQFLVLIAVLAAAVLVAFSRQHIPSLLEALLDKQLSLGLDKQAPSSDRLRAFLPLASDLLLAMLVVAIFYLMASLCHGSGIIINGYVYLGLLEREVRTELGIGRDQIAFTREGPFFEATGRKLTRLIGWCYKSVLGVLLVWFFALRIYFDLPGGGLLATFPGGADASRWYAWAVGNFVLVIDVIVAVPTLLLFVRYTRLSPLAERKVRARLDNLRARAEAEGSDAASRRGAGRQEPH